MPCHCLDCKLSMPRMEKSDFVKEHHNYMQQNAVDYFATKWDLPINCRTVGDI